MGDETVLEWILNGYEDPKDLPLALLNHITNDFSDERKIGLGGFGVVYKGVLQNGIVAVKRIDVNISTIDDVSFRREINSLMKINHQNVVRFLGFCSNTHHISIKEAGSTAISFVNVRERLLCLEYIGNGSLDKHITDELRGLEWKTRYEIIMGICKGLCYLHEEKQIVHMDLKPTNILLDEHMVPKITDFGLSRPNDNSHTMGQRFGTRISPPEYENAGKTSVKSDIYSLGAIIIQLVTGCMDVPDKKNVLRRWRHRWNKPPTLLQYQQVTRCIDISVICRQQEPGHRPSISEIISILSEPESMNGHTGQVSPCFDEDDMLGIKPLELRLPSELKKISCSIELTNDTRNCIAFNIQLPSGQRYITQPYKAIVQPQSKYDMKITLEPRDFHERDHANKFIVQSMKVSEGLRDEEITECMFEEASKVDEVNLMVVYEPAKPQENCKSREDTNVPAVEIPEVKKRKIVESAYGKGKLVSSEHAEASLVRYKDINSRTRSEQTEQRKFYPPQSFSRHYPTNTTYLGKGNRAVDVSRGAMGSLLDKLGKLVKEDYNLERSMKRDIESFVEDLAMIHKDIPNLEKLAGAKIWVDEVRELSYHIEDMVDSFLVHVKPDSSSSGFREFPHEGLKLLENGMTTHCKIGDVIRDIKNKFQDVADRRMKYNINVKKITANATVKATIDLRIPAIYVDKAQLIGIEAPRDKIIRLFEEDGDVSKLKIVSVVGLGGLGKTTLAKAVYDKLQARYHPRAFVPVGLNPDMKIVLKNILNECGCRKDNSADFHERELINNLDEWELINQLQKLLMNERYFIVIDDIWDSSSWDVITSAFPRNSCGSRVITTTRIERVARGCCNFDTEYVYKIKPLSDEDSRRLFCRRTFGSEKDCPDTQKEISIDILKRCGGMPLAINSIAGLLAGEEESTWEYVWKSLGVMTEGDDLENMKQILDLSYIHLPDHLKTCLLCVCMYPEDHEIDKYDLLRKWVAEGLVSTNGRLDAVDVAEKYFKELISMCMIQPWKIGYNNEVLSCRVHDIMLDLMRSKSAEENFIHVIDGLKDVTGAHGGIRRISVHYNDKKDSTILETIKGSLLHARSVLLYRGSLLTCFLVSKYLRVLHIEHRFSSLDLTGVSRLFLLRYLKVTCDDQSGYELKLPNQIGELQQLETIDLHNALLENYPSDIVSLPWLSHLSLTGNEAGVVLPDGIDKLKSLRTLAGADVIESSVENIKGISKLSNLRILEIQISKPTRWEKETTMRMNALHSSICKLSASLKILSFGQGSCLNASCFYFFRIKELCVNVSCWSCRTLFPLGSHIRELDLRGCSFERCPGWIRQLRNLYKFCIGVWEVADGVSIVAGLPSLSYLWLDICLGKREREESVVIPGGGAFKALKVLIFYCKMVSLTFEAGAMPKLEKLEILCRYHTIRQLLPVGIEHLPAPILSRIWLGVHWDDEWQVEGSQDWDDDYWGNYFSYSREHRQNREAVKHLSKRAFKRHHPDANIVVTLVDEYGYDITKGKKKTIFRRQVQTVQDI